MSIALPAEVGRVSGSPHRLAGSAIKLLVAALTQQLELSRQRAELASGGAGAKLGRETGCRC